MIEQNFLRKFTLSVVNASNEIHQSKRTIVISPKMMRILDNGSATLSSVSERIKDHIEQIDLLQDIYINKVEEVNNHICAELGLDPDKVHLTSHPLIFISMFMCLIMLI